MGLIQSTKAPKFRDRGCTADQRSARQRWCEEGAAARGPSASASARTAEAMRGSGVVLCRPFYVKGVSLGYVGRIKT